jgi:hypothetical protein
MSLKVMLPILSVLGIFIIILVVISKVVISIDIRSIVIVFIVSLWFEFFTFDHLMIFKRSILGLILVLFYKLSVPYIIYWNFSTTLAENIFS